MAAIALPASIVVAGGCAEITGLSDITEAPCPEAPGCSGGSGRDGTTAGDEESGAAFDARGGSSSSGADAGTSGSAIDSGLDSPREADAGSVVDGGGPDGAGCGQRTGMRGWTARTMTVAGSKRTYLVYLPASLDPSKPAPFVSVHHGATMSGQAMAVITQYADLADQEGLAAVFPDGQSGPNSLGAPWNVGANNCPTGIGPVPSAPGDDFAFLDAMQSDVSRDQCLDAAHVFVTGFSLGAWFSHHVGCMKADVRAVAPHSGGTHDLGSCAVPRKPILILHGDDDGLALDGCDDPQASNTPAGFTPSATAWAAHNGCSSAVTTTPVKGGECRYYEGCPAGGQVAICVLRGMAHCWAGGAADGGPFSCPGYASATQLEWSFFKTYAW